MNHQYRIFFVFLSFLSHFMHAHVRPIKNLNEFNTYALKPSRGGVIIHTTIDDIDPRTNFSGASSAFNTISNQPNLAGVRFLSVNINAVPDVFIWLSQEGHHIAEWPAFIFIENGKVKAIETKIHGDNLENNIRTGINKHFNAQPAPTTPVASKNGNKTEYTQSAKRRNKRRRRNGRSHMPCK